LRPQVSHLRRPVLLARHPVHVTLRLQRGLASLRQRSLFVAVRAALGKARERFGFRLVHFSVQRDHLHLIAEAEDRRALARGVQGLSVRVARAVNRTVARSGKVFADRYHARVLRTPRQARFALRYVLLNARKHERGAARVPRGQVDACSSAPWFGGFGGTGAVALGAEVPGAAVRGAAAVSAMAARADWRRLSGSDEPPVVVARTWLLGVGALRGGPFDVDDAPAKG
jgi:REP element-mobilizing transposase RayT